nr:hypothetical protein OH820_14040 [Streptomyces sp. NBC_00857]
MDQGLAAVLGALVGAVATGAGAYLPARSADRLHKRQARRDAYLAFLREVEMFQARLHDASTFCDEDQVQSPTAQADRILSELEEGPDTLSRHSAAILIEGPESMFEVVQEILIDAYSASGAMRLIWSEFLEQGDRAPDVLVNQISSTQTAMNSNKLKIAKMMRDLL